MKFLDSTKPFIAAVGTFFALMAAIKGVTEFFPTVAFLQVKGGPKAVDLAVIGAALCLAAGWGSRS